MHSLSFPLSSFHAGSLDTERFRKEVEAQDDENEKGHVSSAGICITKIWPFKVPGSAEARASSTSFLLGVSIWQNNLAPRDKVRDKIRERNPLGICAFRFASYSTRDLTNRAE
jgi:hypothetical protein